MRYVIIVSILSIKVVTLSNFLGEGLSHAKPFHKFKSQLAASMSLTQWNSVSYKDVSSFLGIYDVVESAVKDRSKSIDFYSQLIDYSFEYEMRDSVGRGYPSAVIAESKSLPEIPDLHSFLGCFADLDTSYNYYITLYADLPVSDHEAAVINISGRYPGHSFLKLSAIGRDTVLTRALGLYPGATWTLQHLESIPAKFVDNKAHPFNGSIKRKITAGRLSGLVDFIVQKEYTCIYDLQHYNCTDFAVNVFNHGDDDPVNVPAQQIPGTSQYLHTPSALFSKLKRCQAQGPSDGDTIVISRAKLYD